ncbi:MAG: hypothetical protein IKM02_03985 [Clostridia bacterium]|nr:hypothetical protein [Clostridia bacterium]
MGFFSKITGKTKANKAVRCHASANKASDRGQLDEAKKLFSEALRLYSEAYDSGFRSSNFLQPYAILLMREGDIEKARKIFLEVQNIKGLSKDDWHNLRVNYSICQWKMGQLDKAIETVGHAAREKMNSTVYNTLGMFLVDKARETGEIQEAMDFNMKAMDYDDEDGATLDNLGQLYMAMADIEKAKGAAEKAAEYTAKARSLMEKAHENKPRQITTIYYLAELMYEAGEIEAAREMIHNSDDIYFTALCPVSRAMMEELAKKIG